MRPTERLAVTDLPDLDPELPADPGCAWHPRSDKPNAYLEDGLLPDLNEREVIEHAEKPEALDQPDAALNREPLAAEDSATTPDGVL